MTGQHRVVSNHPLRPRQRPEDPGTSPRYALPQTILALPTLLVAIAALSVPPPTLAQTVYSDGTFLPEGDGGPWTADGPYSNPTGNPLFTFEQVAAEGNPAPSGRSDLHYVTVESGATVVWGFLIHNDHVFDPSSLGAISDINFSWDSRRPAGRRTNPVRTLAIMQNGFLWAAIDARKTSTLGLDWTTETIDNLDESAFIARTEWAQPGQSTNPDFTDSGTPLRFGFVLGTSCPASSDCTVEPSGGIDLDNFNVTITTGGTSSPGEFRFAEADVVVPEDAASVSLSIQRIGGTTGEASVVFRSVDETARDGDDYLGGLATIAFSDGQSESPIDFVIIDDSVMDDAISETFRVELEDPTGGATLGTPSQARVTIVDDDVSLADLALSGSGVARAEDDGAGGLNTFVDYSLTVRNEGQATAVNTTVVFAFDPALLTNPDTTGMYDAATNTWTVGELAVGEQRTLAITFDAPQQASLRLTATASTDTDEPAPDPNVNAVEIRVDTGINLELTLIGPSGLVLLDYNTSNIPNGSSPAKFGSNLPGPEVEFAITLINRGTLTAPDVAVAFDPDPTIAGTFLSFPEGCSARPTDEIPKTYFDDDPGPSAFCQVGDMPPGATVVLEFLTKTHSKCSEERAVDDLGRDGSAMAFAGLNGNAFASVAMDELTYRIINSFPGCGSASGSSSCFIASAAYGSPWHSNVDLLREFRDEKLLTNRFGRAVVDIYYEASPPIATWIEGREWAKALTRALLSPAVFMVRYPAAGGLLGLLLIAILVVRFGRLRGPARRYLNS